MFHSVGQDISFFSYVQVFQVCWSVVLFVFGFIVLVRKYLVFKDFKAGNYQENGRKFWIFYLFKSFTVQILFTILAIGQNYVYLSLMESSERNFVSKKLEFKAKGNSTYNTGSAINNFAIDLVVGGRTME